MHDDRAKNIHYTSRFIKSFKKLPKEIQKMAVKKESVFKKHPFDPQLNTHKLKGKLEGVWSYSIKHEYRIIFRFIDGNEVIYYDIGTHEIYD